MSYKISVWKFNDADKYSDKELYSQLVDDIDLKAIISAANLAGEKPKNTFGPVTGAWPTGPTLSTATVPGLSAIGVETTNIPVKSEGENN